MNMAMPRRAFVRALPSLIALPSVLASGALAPALPATYLVGRVRREPSWTLPERKRVPLGWTAAAVTAKEPLVLSWDSGTLSEPAPVRLRVTVALDVRDEKHVEVSLASSGTPVGTFDIRFANIFQPFEITLDPATARAALREGVELRVTKGSELWIFSRGNNLPEALSPHLLVPGTDTREREFFRRMGSLASLQMFGWMEGCVLDGLLELARLPEHRSMTDVARQHLAQFIHEERLVYENGNSVVSDDILYTIESTLPFAALARLEPDSPLLDRALEFWLARRDEEGAILDRQHSSSEGSYTVAYPLAALARLRKDDQLATLALTQLRVRHRRFFDGKEFWRTRDPDGSRRNRNWARGLAWHLLGFAHTLRTLRDRRDAEDLGSSFRSFCEFVKTFQRSDGLWSAFADEPSLLPDTSGSAGIAAAFAIGAQEGILSSEYAASARRTWDGLLPFLTPDGFLGGATQANKGQEPLQRGEYRVIYQMAMGLMAQLYGALHSRERMHLA